MVKGGTKGEERSELTEGEEGFAKHVLANHNISPSVFLHERRKDLSAYTFEKIDEIPSSQAALPSRGKGGSLSLACCGLDMCVRGSASSSSSPSFSSFERPTQLSCKIPPRNSIHRDKKGLRAEGKTNKEKNGRFGRSPRYISGGGGGKEGACHIAARPMVQLFGQEGDGGERGAPSCHTNYGKVTPPLQGAPRDVATPSKCSFYCSSVWHRSPSP